MIELKQVSLDSTGWLECGWFDGESQVWFQSFHPTQEQMLRDKAAEYGTPLSDYEEQISSWVTNYVPPAPEPIHIPSNVSPRQIRMALTRSNLRQQVEDAVAAGSQDLKDWWNYSTTFERNNPQVEAMATAVGVTPEAVDQLWILAATL